MTNPDVSQPPMTNAQIELLERELEITRKSAAQLRRTASYSEGPRVAISNGLSQLARETARR